jgi:hypothetical protein
MIVFDLGYTAAGEEARSLAELIKVSACPSAQTHAPPLVSDFSAQPCPRVGLDLL